MTESPPMSETALESPSPADADEEETPTYAQDTWAGLDRYLCLLCGHQAWADSAMMQHMEQFHQGSMIAAPAGSGPEAAASPSVAAPEEWAGQETETAETDPATSPETPAPAEG